MPTIPYFSNLCYNVNNLQIMNRCDTKKLIDNVARSFSQRAR